MQKVITHGYSNIINKKLYSLFLCMQTFDLLSNYNILKIHLRHSWNKRERDEYWIHSNFFFVLLIVFRNEEKNKSFSSLTFSACLSGLWYSRTKRNWMFILVPKILYFYNKELIIFVFLSLYVLVQKCRVSEQNRIYYHG